MSATTTPRSLRVATGFPVTLAGCGTQAVDGRYTAMRAISTGAAYRFQPVHVELFLIRELYVPVVSLGKLT